jgi:cellulose biosynthesis protein BcsQ
VVNQREVRFRFRQVFHHPSVFHQFQYVFFDCPPRLTTSTINALAVSDYILIPTGLDPSDVEAVPRTLGWVNQLRGLPGFEATLAGVVVNGTYRQGALPACLTSKEKPQWPILIQHIQRFIPTGNVVLGFAIPESTDLNSTAAGAAPYTCSHAGQVLFRDLVAELLPRISV